MRSPCLVSYQLMTCTHRIASSSFLIKSSPPVRSLLNIGSSSRRGRTLPTASKRWRLSMRTLTMAMALTTTWMTGKTRFRRKSRQTNVKIGNRGPLICVLIARGGRRRLGTQRRSTWEILNGSTGVQVALERIGAVSRYSWAICPRLLRGLISPTSCIKKCSKIIETKKHCIWSLMSISTRDQQAETWRHFTTSWKTISCRARKHFSLNGNVYIYSSSFSSMHDSY